MDSSGFYLIDPEYNVISMNDTARNLYPGLKIGEKCYKCLMNLDSPCGPCPVVAGIQGPRTYTDPIRKISETVDAVEVPVEGHGLCHALVFSTVGIDAEFAATLPTSAEELKQLSLIKALTIDYYDVMSVSLSDGRMKLYRHNGKAVDLASVYGQLDSYLDGLENYIEKYVYPDDQENMRACGSLEYIKNQLMQQESFSVHYRVILNGELHYYYRMIVRIGEVESFENVVIGVACEDETVLNYRRLIELEKRLKQVNRDSLTGLYTKEAFMERGNRLLSRETECLYDFCILKVENISLINHQYGELIVNKVIQLIGRLLKEYVTEDNVMAYLGNGMFASLSQNTPDPVRKKDIYKLRGDILRLSEIKNISLKWSIYKEIRNGSSLSEIYEKTTYALSTIRASMHEDYVEFNQAMIEKMERETRIENTFEESLENGEFIAWFQPKYSVKSQRIVGAEALVRWIRPDGSMVLPAEFIPTLEKCGKINQLDAYVFGQVCRIQQYLKTIGILDLPISVNLSRASMFTENIAKKYFDMAEMYEVETKNIPIEITESAAIRATSIRSFAKELIDKGFVLHMDDFGSGYSSLASLHVIPFESIKLDKSLVDFIGDYNGENLLKHVVEFAKESGKTVVAEGVESYEQYLYLKIIGCDAIQGYYFSKPVDEETFINFLKS